MIPDECTFFSCPPFIWTLLFQFLLFSYAIHGLLLQLLLLNLGEDGKIVGALLVQKKTSMLFVGNSANSCCNLENIRYTSFLLGNVMSRWLCCLLCNICTGILKIQKSMNLMSNRLVLKFLLWPPTVVTCFYYSYKMIINCIVHYREWCRICWNKYYLILLFMINVFLILIVGTRAASVHWRDCVLLYLSQARYGGLSINWPSFSHIHCYISCYYHFCCLYFPAMSLYRWVTPFD